jgi:hypothetical protein
MQMPNVIHELGGVSADGRIAGPDSTSDITAAVGAR